MHDYVKDLAAKSVALGTTSFEKHSVPPDGLRCYHSILGALHFSTWQTISRNESGYAVNRRTVQTESANAYALRDLAIKNTDPANPLLSRIAREASCHLTIDIAELSWLGTVLNLAIRCTIDEQAGLFINVPLQYSRCFVVCQDSNGHAVTQTRIFQEILGKEPPINLKCESNTSSLQFGLACSTVL